MLDGPSSLFHYIRKHNMNTLINYNWFCHIKDALKHSAANVWNSPLIDHLESNTFGHNIIKQNCLTLPSNTGYILHYNYHIYFYIACIAHLDNWTWTLTDLKSLSSYHKFDYTDTADKQGHFNATIKDGKKITKQMTSSISSRVLLYNNEHRNLW